ncbi:winged helix-turn-helix transcriptional regulator [Streptomyces sp. AV19]|uniref:ArsR/SmtB family transcription factor n=1 Tax=Streptomyces sp. AV19 TaxID=2793068 RepID=UPI0018FEC170|nr:metalloregulator ArsR/SmtB family transcription factor [Streptomyces sp. AV19]MBH1937068.1 winged helix-turn-helix transcriptional regulator [Streptomyces sp. AV19]MDG4535907.1 metalloregulator ArsR/SmtB family transcription factor [Streptomyces sp. AV19]
MAAGVGRFEGTGGQGADPSADVLNEAAAAFGLLASPARLHLVWALAQGESDVSGLAERVGGALPAISQHLAKLKLAGLVRSRREGRRVVYLVDDPHVVTIVHLMVGQLADRQADAVPRSRTGSGSGRLRGLGA